MRKRSSVRTPPVPAAPGAEPPAPEPNAPPPGAAPPSVSLAPRGRAAPGYLALESDAYAESLVVAAALRFPKERRRLVSRLAPDTFAEPRHRPLWAALQELERQRLDFDVPTLMRLGGDGLDEAYVLALLGDVSPAVTNVAFHEARLLRDHAGRVAAKGPLGELLKALADPRTELTDLHALTVQLSDVFRGEARTCLHDGEELTREAMSDLRERQAGGREYLFGIPGLDFYDPEAEAPKRRLITGSAPGAVTLVTGYSSHGKSTMALNLAHGLRKQGRRVLIGAWEVHSKKTLELMATIELGFSREQVALGKLTELEMEEMEDTMRDIAKQVRFMDAPFFRAFRTVRPTNESNLDLIRGYMADSGCDVFIPDLLRRAFVRFQPEDEEIALNKMQAIAQETKVHCILIQQQLIKGADARNDPRPTREGTKGSAAWVEIADTVLAPFYAFAVDSKRARDKMEVFVLKQRFGFAPLAIEFDYDPSYGKMRSGRDVPYRRTGELAEGSEIDAEFVGPRKGGGGWGPGGGKGRGR